MIELSIVMPCFNEAETLAICIKKARNFLDREMIQGEIIVSDNGSTDGSIEIAIENNAKVVHTEIKGYGAALQTGIVNSSGKFIIMGDSDDSYDFDSLMPIVEKLRGGYDFVMGNRFKGGIKKGAMPFLHKYLGNPVLSFIGRLFFKSKINDFHCGLRGFTKIAYEQMNLKTTGMEFASEMVVMASLHKMNVTEVPVILYPDGRSRPPHLNTWRDGWRHLKFLLLLSPRWLFFYPSLFIIFFSIILGTLILISPLQINGVIFDIHTLIILSFLLINGVQILFLHYFATIFTSLTRIIPSKKLYNKKLFSLETGLIAGSLLFILGIIQIMSNFNYWSSHNYSDLNPVNFVRRIIIGVIPITIGIQIIVNSFMLSILTMIRKK